MGVQGLLDLDLGQFILGETIIPRTVCTTIGATTWIVVIAVIIIIGGGRKGISALATQTICTTGRSTSQSYIRRLQREEWRDKLRDLGSLGLGE